MKKYLFLFLLFVSTTAHASTWYVTQAGSGSANGTSYANSWSYAGITWGSVVAGDTMYLCDTFRQRTFAVGTSGYVGSPIIIRGNYTGHAGIINGGNLITGFSLVSGSVYKVTYSPSSYRDYMFSEDVIPLTLIAWNTDEATTVAAMTVGSYCYHGTTLYVRTRESDNPSGHSIENPTGVQYDILLDLRGRSYLTVTNISIRNAFDYGFGASASSGLLVDGITADNIWDWGIYVENSPSPETKNCVMKYCSRGGAPVFITGSGNIGEVIRYHNVTGGSIHNNDISKASSCGIDLTATTNGTSVYLNTIHDSDLAYEGAGGIYVDNGQNNLVYQNITYNCSNGAGLSVNSETDGTQSSGNKFYNNICYLNKGGIYLGNDFGSGHKRSSENFVYNNTFYGNGSYVDIHIAAGSQNETVENNIVFTLNALSGASVIIDSGGETGLTMDYNLYYRDDGNLGLSYKGEWDWSLGLWQAHGLDAHGINSNPNFVDATNKNFRLTYGSPAVNKGVTLASVTVDYEGTARPQSTAYDIGAYESPYDTPGIIVSNLKISNLKVV